HISGYYRLRHRQGRPTTSHCRPIYRVVNFLHATGRFQWGAGVEFERERFRQRSRPPILHGIQRRAEAADRAGDGRLGRITFALGEWFLYARFTAVAWLEGQHVLSHTSRRGVTDSLRAGRVTRTSRMVSRSATRGSATI